MDVLEIPARAQERVLRLAVRPIIVCIGFLLWCILGMVALVHLIKVVNLGDSRRLEQGYPERPLYIC